MTFKRCTYFGEIRPITHFQRDTHSRDGFTPQCKTCRNTKRRFYRQAGNSGNLTRNQEREMNRVIHATILKQHQTNPAEVILTAR